jgi:hypothetical protein
LLTQFNRRTGPQTQGNKTLPHALLTQFNRRTGPQTQGNKTLPHALLNVLFPCVCASTTIELISLLII